ncbi:MAG: ribose 5-phosphate isomerase B [Armatimonadetes bacterium]|nr:ribose 5-phosphate isomerase B [Armatimonadota bacterium]
MKVAFGCDHAGLVLRRPIFEALAELPVEVLDFGVADAAPVDYCTFAEPVARAVSKGEADLGILACGTGVGMAIAANKVPGAYAAHASDPYTARMAREHNAANILTLGGRVVGPGLAQEIVQAFVTAQPSSEERHVRRRSQFVDLERRALQGGR